MTENNDLEVFNAVFVGSTPGPLIIFIGYVTMIVLQEMLLRTLSLAIYGQYILKKQYEYLSEARVLHIIQVFYCDSRCIAYV